jgi:acetolactate synthase-1/2/3 large subunit
VDYRNPDFGALAKVIGAHSEHVTKPGELKGALQRALTSGKPAAVDVLIDQKPSPRPSTNPPKRFPPP